MVVGSGLFVAYPLSFARCRGVWKKKKRGQDLYLLHHSREEFESELACLFVCLFVCLFGAWDVTRMFFAPGIVNSISSLGL